MADKVIHFGFFIRKTRENRGWSRAHLAEEMKRHLGGEGRRFSEKRLWEIEAMPEPRVHARTLGSLAGALGYRDAEELEKVWRTNPVAPPDEGAPRMTVELAAADHMRLIQYAMSVGLSPLAAAKALLLEALAAKLDCVGELQVSIEPSTKSNGPTAPAVDSPGHGPAPSARSRR